MYATIISYSQSYLQFPKISPPSWVAVSRRVSAKDVPSSITMKGDSSNTRLSKKYSVRVKIEKFRQPWLLLVGAATFMSLGWWLDDSVR